MTVAPTLLIVMTQHKTVFRSTPPRMKFAPGAAVLLTTVLVPALGAWAAGRGLKARLQFPPPLEIPEYPRWSWFAAALVAGLLSAIAISWVRGRRTTNPSESATAPQALSRWPWWGSAALVWTLVWWLLAWTRFTWFSSVQRYTFFPLWLGFVVSVNALVVQRTGTCFPQRAPRRWLVLFAASASFWWIFEWLNRFVENWHYLGVQDLSALSYALHASLCFSTVLPAVAVVREWLASFPAFVSRAGDGPARPWLQPRGVGVVLVGVAIVALLFAGAAPVQSYAAVWAAPVLLAFGVGIITRQPGLWSELAAGDWRRTAAWALAALVCGFFWELWNVCSAAKWIYTVPHVDRWHLFEMPLLGYAGYLGFGLECALVTEWVTGADVVDDCAGPENQRAC